MRRLQKIGFILLGLALLAILPAASAEISQPAPDTTTNAALPASAWWLVTHHQCNDTLHWINPSGQYAAMPRPKLPNEAPATPCSSKAMHISQNGRYLALVAALTTGRNAVGFYDLQTGQWLRVHEAQPNEQIYLGQRYSSSKNSQIAISFVTIAPTAWRVAIYNMVTGDLVDELRSDGTEIASFVGGEFLATAQTIPMVTLLAHDDATNSDQVHIRFDSLATGTAPLGAAAWYPQGAPGVGQALISSPYTYQALDLLPDGKAIFTYADPGYPAGPPVSGILIPTTTNAVGLMLPTTLGGSATPQLYFVDGASTVYTPSWASDGRIAVFRRYDNAGTKVYWIKLGTSVLVPLEGQPAQILGVPTGFVFNTANGIYFVDENTSTVSGPIFSDAALSGGMAFVWATAFGNPTLALDTLPQTITLPVIVTATAPGVTLPPVATLPPVVVVTPTVDNPICRLASADASNVNIRSGPGTNYPTIGQISATTELNIIGQNGQWYVVNYSGQQGWVAGWVTTLKGNCTGLAFVTAPPPPPPTATPPGAYINFYADRTNISAGQCANISWKVEYIREVYFENEGVTGEGTRQVCPGTTTTYTLRVILTDGSTQTRTVTITVGAGGGQPDLYVSEFSLNPSTPIQGQPVEVRIGIYNQGSASVSGTSFRIEWYPGENYPSPACAWDLDSMSAGGGRILTCTYAGYPSPYGSINTMVKVDTTNAVTESNEGNNTYLKAISVSN
jgi:hypothetical protein